RPSISGSATTGSRPSIAGSATTGRARVARTSTTARAGSASATTAAAEDSRALSPTRGRTARSATGPESDRRDRGPGTTDRSEEADRRATAELPDDPELRGQGQGGVVGPRRATRIHPGGQGSTPGGRIVTQHSLTSPARSLEPPTWCKRYIRGRVILAASGAGSMPHRAVTDG